MLKVQIIPVTPFQQNCSLVWCDETMQGAVVDPGGDLDRIVSMSQKHGVNLTQILITHGHIDHCGGALDLKSRLDVPIIGPEKEDQFWIATLAEDGAKYGFAWAKPFVPDRWLDDGDEVEVGNEKLGVLHCPGHTPGHVVFYHAGQKLAIVGDVLFKDSVGRTDFPRGNTQDLIDSICDKLWPLGNDVSFIPGHGPMSTFGDERARNPYVSDAAVARKPS